MSASAQSHVPKFGNWDGDNVPYTAYFENARKEKAGIRINPNDPEENPEAFMVGQGGGSISDHGAEGGNHHRFSAVNSHNRDKWTSSEKQWNSAASESHGSDRSGSGYSRRQESHNPVRPDQGHKKGPSESSQSLSTSATRSPQRTRQWSGNQPSDETHRRVALIPKFGAWDETDPRSGESFTVIFNKVKEEKHIAASRFPTVPDQPINSYPTNQDNERGHPPIAKICCCLLWRRSG